MKDLPPASASASDRKRDAAARAAWLYFIAGRTQDEIAQQLGVSRQAAQRLVAQAVSDGLIRFRMDHPIAACMDLGARLAARHGLVFCDVCPTDPRAPEDPRGVAIAVAARLERLLSEKSPLIVTVGTGRTLRAAVDEMGALDRPQHRIVSLVGAMAAGGHATPYEVVMRLADKLGAQRYPMPAPVLTETVEDRRALQSQRAFAVLRDLRDRAQASFVGVSDVGHDAPVRRDGFMSEADIDLLLAEGAAGEITGWPFDAEGRVLDNRVTTRIASLPLEQPPRRLTVACAFGPRKVGPLRAALSGRLVTALVTDEATARALLDD